MSAINPKPARIGKYDIISVVGRGGMGVVYRGIDSRIGRPVAIKVLTDAYCEEQDLLERFYREARYTGGLQHQNIVTVYDFGEQDGFPFLVMEYLEGDSLDKVITSHRPLQIAEKLAILVQVCKGLSFAHERGVVHRDIKPANIVVLKNGTAKIVDFGIAHVGGHGLTRTGQVVGSIYYMSPEQLGGLIEVDARTDIYSTGVVLFQLLTGVLPFKGRDTGSTLMKIVHEPPPQLGSFISNYPAELEAIIQKALAKDREQRYASAEEFAFELEQLQRDLTRELVADLLLQADTAIEHKEYSGAREHLLSVLRLDSQNATANRLLRQIQQGFDQERRQEQEKQLLAGGGPEPDPQPNLRARSVAATKAKAAETPRQEPQQTRPPAEQIRPLSVAPDSKAKGSSFDETYLLGDAESLEDIAHWPSPSAIPAEVQAAQIPEELKEFLPPQGFSRFSSRIWVAVGVLLLAAAVYLVFSSKTASWHKNGNDSQRQTIAAPGTYAVINAEPWATVTEVLSLKGDILRTVNDQTPLRLELPAGRYKIQMQGPGGEQQELAVEIPNEGGNSYFVLFRKPEIRRLVTPK
jgi:serine/threonine protein kinase